MSCQPPGPAPGRLAAELHHQLPHLPVEVIGLPPGGGLAVHPHAVLGAAGPHEAPALGVLGNQRVHAVLEAGGRHHAPLGVGGGDHGAVSDQEG